MTTSRRALFALPALASLSQSKRAAAQSLPDRPVVIVVPYAPGGTIDVLARALAPELSRELGQNVVIDTRPGAGGNVGAAFVAQQSRPDTHTLLFTGAGLASSVSLSNLPFDPRDSLIPLAGIGAIPSLAIVSLNSPHRTLQTVLEQARAAPGSVSYGSSRPGTGSHLAGVLLAAAANVELNHVPYRGSAAVYPDLMAQRIDILLDIMASSLGPVQQGSVRALATTSARRSTSLPDVPTVAESGVPGYEFSTWVGLFTRSGAPDAAVRHLEAAVLRAASAPAMVDRLRAAAAEPIPADGVSFRDYFLRDVQRWAGMVRDGRLERFE